MSTCAAEPGTSTQRLLTEIEAHLAMARVGSRENELIAAARDELIQLDWAVRLVMEANARDRGPKSAAENDVTRDAEVPPELRDGRIVDTPHPDSLPDGSLSKSTAKRIEALAKLPLLPAGDGARELYAHLLDMLGARDHEDAARIIAEHHAREIQVGDGARVTDVMVREALAHCPHALPPPARWEWIADKINAYMADPSQMDRDDAESAARVAALLAAREGGA